MVTNRVVFSFFRYRTSHTLNAFILMGFQGLVRDKTLPPGKARLMGCGSGDGFSIVPDLRAYCLMSSVPDDGDWERIKGTRLYRFVARPAIEQLHFHLRPMTGHGTWDGDPLFDYSRARPDGEPFVVLTHARVASNRTYAFWSHVPAIRRHLAEAPGCAYHMGFGEHPLRTLATFSVWEDLEPMRQFAYRHSPHHDATRAARAEDWLSESMFVRFHIDRVEGDLQRHPKLLQLMCRRDPELAQAA
jgi:heme-degrading monooxygenase HmoA